MIVALRMSGVERVCAKARGAAPHTAPANAAMTSADERTARGENLSIDTLSETRSGIRRESTSRTRSRLPRQAGEMFGGCYNSGHGQCRAVRARHADVRALHRRSDRGDSDVSRHYAGADAG